MILTAGWFWEVTGIVMKSFLFILVCMAVRLAIRYVRFEFRGL